MKDNLAIAYTSFELLDKAKELSELLQLPLVDLSADEHEFLLVCTPTRLEFRQNTEIKQGPVYVDFLQGALHHRGMQSAYQRELIVRACGLSKNTHARVIDATAGLGRDAFILACQGADVAMLERSPIIAALLQDGLRRLKENEEVRDIIKLQLIHEEAKDYLQHLTVAPDIIYLDPMHPERSKSALVKKEMRILRKIVGFDADCEELFDIALQTAEKRVVVKRPCSAGPMKELKPNHEFEGKTCRFDVYLT